MNLRMKTDISARSSQLARRPFSSHGGAAARPAAFSANTSCMSTATARRPTSSSSLAAVGAQAALRHEQQRQQACATSRWVGVRSPAFHASSLPGASPSSFCSSGCGTPRVTGSHSVRASTPESSSPGQSAPMAGELSTLSTPAYTSLQEEVGSANNDSRMPCTLADTNSSTFQPVSCGVKTAGDHAIQALGAPLLRGTSYRAKRSHLVGCAAVVSVPGPLDGHYVPMRRPAPGDCVATRQHFSVFEGAYRPGRGLERSAIEPRAAAGARAGKHFSHGIIGDAFEFGIYKTTNSAYGRGC
ncbi:hypothetical protein JKF63_01126 [Porcisia hertigi]|uniref:Uncharacterized protein n=1 Tax=Porcisia hertigi TaxID=2761500 RepID=A0A836L9L7_9TRYP|nr:hypothetical protein JKF63_01126 [Porcisia hertigi]